MWNSPSLLAMFIVYAEQSKASGLLDAEKQRVEVSKDIVFDEVAEWFPSTEISGSTGSTDNSTHQIEESLKSRTPGPEDEEGRTYQSLDSGQEISSQARNNKNVSEHVAGVRLLTCERGTTSDL